MPVMNVIVGDLSYTLGVGQGNTFLRLAGNLCGSHTAARVGTVFQRALNHVSDKFFLSLEGCYAIDSEALALLIQQQKTLGAMARDLVLVDVPIQIMKLLEASHLTSLCEVLPSLEDAEKKYGYIS